MTKDIYDPLSEYVNVFRQRFKDVAEKTFTQLATESQVDITANRETCKQLYTSERALSSVKNVLSLWNCLCVILWIGIIAGAAFCIIRFNELSRWTVVTIGAIVLAVIILFFLLIYPHIKKIKSEKDGLTDKVDKLKKEAYGQMEPLNSLYDWEVLIRMMTETVSKLEFDPYFTTQRLADLKETYGWDDSFNAQRSVIYSHSGLINGNPFVLCRTRKMVMGARTYSGSKTIYWTTCERGSDGKYHTVQHSETLTAYVTAPFPEYFEKTWLIYGNTAAPDLIFYRKQSGLAEKVNSFSFKWKRRLLRKKARDLSNQDFAMMTNEEFEVAFDTSNRNDNQQYALLFTPLAQESMMSLLKDTEAGFGDDFDFDKNKMINIIVSNHVQGLNLDLNPDQYRHFDFDKAKDNFYMINARYFRAIYFCLAPLLCIPMYQQIRPQQAIYHRGMKQHSSFWEHEALANFWGQNHFKHPQCVTDCILKTEQQKIKGDASTITVFAYGYQAVQRLTYIEKWGGDGRTHSVPVYWDEYLPVTGTGKIDMMEDNDFDNEKASLIEREGHIANLLGNSHFDAYRRHIASKIQ